MKEKVLIIVGPTASGKSALAVKLAKRFDGEIISADSRQVYKGLNIGTGKITKREMRGVPHHLLDVVSPKKYFSAADFAGLARSKIAMIYHSGKLPIVVGGTGYYIDALVGRIAMPDVAPDAVLRARLAKKTVEQLFAMLKKRDPRRAATMATPSERNNKVRLVRALEIACTENRPLYTEVGSLYDVLWIGTKIPLSNLERKISSRLAARFHAGMIAEARRLRKGGLSFKRMKELGLEYRSLARFLQRKISRDELSAELQRDIRRYAKKQMAYWNRNKHIKWFEPTDTRIEKAVKKWLKT